MTSYSGGASVITFDPLKLQDTISNITSGQNDFIDCLNSLGDDLTNISAYSAFPPIAAVLAAGQVIRAELSALITTTVGGYCKALVSVGNNWMVEHATAASPLNYLMPSSALIKQLVLKAAKKLWHMIIPASVFHAMADVAVQVQKMFSLIQKMTGIVNSMQSWWKGISGGRAISSWLSKISVKAPQLNAKLTDFQSDLRRTTNDMLYRDSGVQGSAAPELIKWDIPNSERTLHSLQDTRGKMPDIAARLSNPPGGINLLRLIGADNLYAQARSVFDGGQTGLSNFIKIQDAYYQRITAPQIMTGASADYTNTYGSSLNSAYGGVQVGKRYHGSVFDTILYDSIIPPPVEKPDVLRGFISNLYSYPPIPASTKTDVLRSFAPNLQGIKPQTKLKILDVLRNSQANRQAQVPQSFAPNKLLPRTFLPNKKWAYLIQPLDQPVKGVSNLVSKLLASQPRLPVADAQNKAIQFKPITNGQLFVDGISRNDIKQNGLQDCYFLATLASLADTAEGRALIQKAIKDNGNGTYTVTFYQKENGVNVPKQVTVSADFPTNTQGQPTGPIYAAPTDAGKQEMWVALMQKAYAQLHGGYDKIGNGGFSSVALEELTGKSIYWTSNASITPTQQVAQLQQMLASGQVVTASTKAADANTSFDTVADPNNPGQTVQIARGHTYSVIAVDGAKNVVTMYNPWGQQISISVADYNALFAGMTTGGIAANATFVPTTAQKVDNATPVVPKTGFFGKLFKGIGKVFKGVGKVVGKVVGGVSKVVGGITNGIIKVGQGAIGFLAKGVSFIPVIGKPLSKGLNWVKKNFGTIVNIASMALPLFGIPVPSLAGLAGKALPWLTKAVPWIGKAATFAQNTLGKIKNFIPSFITKGVDIYKNIRGTLGQLGGIFPVFNKVGNWIDSKLPFSKAVNFYDKTIGFLNKADAALANMTGKKILKAEPTVQGTFAQRLAQQFPFLGKAASSVIGFIDKSKAWINKNLPWLPKILNTAKKVKGYIEGGLGVADDIVGKIGGIWPAAGRFLKKGTDWLRGKVATPVTNFIGKVTAPFDRANSFIGKVRDAAGLFLDPAKFKANTAEAKPRDYKAEVKDWLLKHVPFLGKGATWVQNNITKVKEWLDKKTPINKIIKTIGDIKGYIGGGLAYADDIVKLVSAIVPKFGKKLGAGVSWLKTNAPKLIPSFVDKAIAAYGKGKDWVSKVYDFASYFIAGGGKKNPFVTDAENAAKNPTDYKAKVKQFVDKNLPFIGNAAKLITSTIDKGKAWVNKILPDWAKGLLGDESKIKTQINGYVEQANKVAGFVQKFWPGAAKAITATTQWLQDYVLAPKKGPLKDIVNTYQKVKAKAEEIYKYASVLLPAATQKAAQVMTKVAPQLVQKLLPGESGGMPTNTPSTVSTKKPTSNVPPLPANAIIDAANLGNTNTTVTSHTTTGDGKNWWEKDHKYSYQRDYRNFSVIAEGQTSSGPGDFPTDAGAGTTLYEKSASGSVLVGKKGSKEIAPGVTAGYRAGAWADGQAGFKVTSKGVQAQAKGAVGVGFEGSIQGSGSWKFGPGQLDVSGKGTVFAGAKAEGEVNAGFGLDEYGRPQAYIGGQASALAGVEAKAEGKASLKVFGQEVIAASGSAGVIAGIGAAASFKAGYKDGKLSFGGGFKIALGVGISLNFNISLNIGGIVNAAKKIWNGAKSLVQDVGKGIGNAVKSVGSAIGKGIKAVGNFFGGLFGGNKKKKREEFLRRRGEEIARDIRNFGKTMDVAKTFVSSVKQTVGGVKKTIDGYLGRADELGKQIGQFVPAAQKYIQQGTNWVRGKVLNPANQAIVGGLDKADSVIGQVQQVYDGIKKVLPKDKPSVGASAAKLVPANANAFFRQFGPQLQNAGFTANAGGTSVPKIQPTNFVANLSDSGTAFTAKLAANQTAPKTSINSSGDITKQYGGFTVKLKDNRSDTPPTTTVNQTPSDFAKTLLNSSRVTFATVHPSGVKDQATAALQIRDAAAGKAVKLSSYGNAPGGTVKLNGRMLQALLQVSKEFKLGISEIAGGSHSVGSKHYAGIAFDINTIDGRHVGPGNPNYQKVMARFKALGATLILGPNNDPDHQDHLHIQFPAGAKIVQSESPAPVEKPKGQTPKPVTTKTSPTGGVEAPTVKPTGLPAKISQAGVDFIKGWEGWYPYAYYDLEPESNKSTVHPNRPGEGTLTIGWGHVPKAGEGITINSKITKARGEKFLTDDIAIAEKLVRDNVKVGLTQDQYDVLVAMAMNGGNPFLYKGKPTKLGQTINSGKLEAVPDVIRHFRITAVGSKGKPVYGLIRRREDEAQYWEGRDRIPQNVTKAETFVGGGQRKPLKQTSIQRGVFTVTLKQGDRSAKVAELQELLNANGATLPTTGNFLDMTLKAVEDFQRSRGLPVTGAVDKATWDALVAKKPAITVATPSSKVVTPITPTVPVTNLPVTSATQPQGYTNSTIVAPGAPPPPIPKAGTTKYFNGWGDGLFDFSQVLVDPDKITYTGKYGGGSKGFFDKAPILPKYQPAAYVQRRNAQGRFLPKATGWGRLSENNPDFAPTAPGKYFRYNGTDFGGPKYYSRDPKTGKVVEVKPTQARDPKTGRFLPKVQPSKLKPTFFEYNQTNEALKGVKGSQQFNDWLGGSYKAGAWGTATRNFNVSSDGVEGKFGVGVGVGAEGKLTASGQWKTGPAQFDASGNLTGFVGAKADAEVKGGIGKDEYGRFQAYTGGRATAFAGVEGKLEGKGDVSVGGHHLGSVGGSAGVTAGIGGEIKGDIGYRDGKFRVAGGGKFAVGLGLSANVDISVDVAGIAGGIKDGAGKAWDGAKNLLGF